MAHIQIIQFYCMSKKSLPLLYSKLYYNMDQDFLNNKHTICRRLMTGVIKSESGPSNGFSVHILVLSGKTGDFARFARAVNASPGCSRNFLFVSLWPENKASRLEKFKLR